MKRALLAFLTFGVVLAAVAGFAASMNVGGTSLGAGTGVVSECDDVTVTWPTPAFNGVTSKYTVASVTLNEDNAGESPTVNACQGKAVEVRVGNQVKTGTFGTGSVSLTFDTVVDVDTIDTVHVLVS